MSPEDYEKEGFAYLQEEGLKIWGKKPQHAFDDWKLEGGFYWVIDFIKVQENDNELVGKSLLRKK